jgi:AraC-like DNA-binding protein
MTSMAQKRRIDRVAEVVENGLRELVGQRWEQAAAQFALAEQMSVAATVRSVPLVRDAAARRARDPRYSSSLGTGLAILMLFTPEAPAWGISEIAAELGMSRSTVHRYCVTLVRLGHITQEGMALRKYRAVVIAAPEYEVAADLAEGGAPDA